MNFTIPTSAWGDTQGCVGIANVRTGSYFIVPAAYRFTGYVFDRAVRSMENGRYTIYEVGKDLPFALQLGVGYVVRLVTPDAPPPAAVAEEAAPVAADTEPKIFAQDVPIGVWFKVKYDPTNTKYCRIVADYGEVIPDYYIKVRYKKPGAQVAVPGQIHGRLIVSLV